MPIEDIYPLTPVQQGMLFHSLSAPGTGVYVQQLSCSLRGHLDVEAFRGAWDAVVSRHAALRTAFVWQRVETPVQVVLEGVRTSWTELDWRGDESSAREAQWESLLASDMARGFELSQAPLMRMTLVRVGSSSYRFVWSSHHLLLDGWSVPIVLQEVRTHYEALGRGVDVSLKRPPRYRDYISWLGRQDGTRSRSFWRRLLRGVTAPTPVGGVRGSELAASGPQEPSREPLVWSTACTSELGQAARRLRVTLNTLVQAAWALVLSRYSGESDVVFGVTAAGRPPMVTGVEAMVGVFINTLPMRVRVCERAAVGEWLRQLHAQQVEWRQHEYSSLVQVQEWSEIPRGQPLFESLIVFENYPLGRTTWDEAKLAITDVGINERTNYPLTVLVVPGNELQGHIAYDGSRFSAAAVARMARHMETVLAGLAGDTGRAVGDVPLLDAAERRQLLVEWNATETPVSGPESIGALWEAQVARTPSAVALVCGEAHVSYSELDRRANRLAHYLRELGVGPEVLVGLCVERSVEMVVGLLGILKAGGAYVPLDPEHPPARLAFVLAETHAAVVLTQQRWLDRLPAAAGEVVCLDRDWPVIAGMRCDSPALSATADNLAYVMYTSGSTGTPKGVMVPHAGIRNRLLWMQAEYQLTASDRVLHKTPFGFDVSVWELFWPLITGACLVVAAPGGHRDPAYLGGVVSRQGITTIHFVPSMFRAFLQELQLDACLSLQRVICSGETLSPDLQQHALASLHAELYNLYGPTEASIDVSVWKCRTETHRELVPIGRPIANVQLHVLDRWGEPTAVGVWGELHIGGVCLARGYLSRPALTAGTFGPNPFGVDGTRLYATGDLARYRADGVLEFGGRRDGQVKIRGFRVEVGEIEGALAEHAGVRDSAVVARGEEGAGKRVVAYVVRREGATVSVDELRRHLGSRLPEYMVPSGFVFLESLPVTSSGKLDRCALPAPEGVRPEIETGYVSPRTPVESVLAEIWAEVLGLERVGVEDNFFALGGDSIRGIQIVARAMQRNVRVAPRQLFQHQTVAELAAVAEPAEEEGGSDEQGLVEGAADLTPIQCWFMEQEIANRHHWNQSVLLAAPEVLELSAVERVMQALVVHHDALRLRFRRGESGWEQWHAGVESSPVPCMEVELSDGDFSATVARVGESAQSSLNLTTGPIGRVVLFRGPSPAASGLLLVFHHLVVDGVSWRILLEDFHTAYGQACRGAVISLPRKTTSYQRWAAVQSSHAGELSSELAYWLRQGQGAVPRVPVDGPGGTNCEGTAERVTKVLSAEGTGALLREVPKAYRTRVTEVLLTALGMALSGWTGEESWLVDVEGHGREELDSTLNLSRTVGWFTTIYPVRLSAVAEPGAALRAMKERLRGIPSHGLGYGLLRYVGDESARAGLSGLSASEVSFNYLGEFDQSLAAAGFRWRSEASGASRSQAALRRYVLEVQGMVLDGQLQVTWTYSSALHRRSTVEGLAQAYASALESLIAHCVSPDAGGYTPSDFPHADLKQGDVDSILLEMGTPDRASEQSSSA